MPTGFRARSACTSGLYDVALTDCEGGQSGTPILKPMAKYPFTVVGGAPRDAPNPMEGLVECWF